MGTSNESWLTKKLALLVSLVALISSAAGAGVTYATLQSRITYSEQRISKLENQEADKTRWQVDRHEKEIIEQREELKHIREELSAKLDKMQILLARIDQRTGGAK